MRYLKLFGSLLLRALPIALALDLIYLYYAKGWTDPNTLIRITEIVLLYLFVVIYIAWTVNGLVRVIERD